MCKQLTTPVLFLVFNRPEKTKEVFEVIRQARPTKLYVAVDAPRETREDDIINCKKVKEIVHNVDWPCKAQYLEQTKNLGCTLSGKTAWDWIFSQEDRMIFLEDDGLTTPSFFYYCQELLEKYKNDNRIAYIGGVNYNVFSGNDTYFFSHLSVPTYGMATWKRVYDLYEYDLHSYPNVRNTKEFRNRFINKFERDWFIASYDKYYYSVKNGKRENTYDKQQSYLIWKHNMLCIHPNKNLVRNIGFDFAGSNTSVDPNSWIAQFFNRQEEEVGVIKHPSIVSIDQDTELRMFKGRVLLHQPYFKEMIWFYVYNFYKKYIKSFIKK